MVTSKNNSFDSEEINKVNDENQNDDMSNCQNDDLDTLEFCKLPKLLLNVSDGFEDRHKVMMLLSAITVISSALPNVHGYYNQQKVYPNLLLYVVGKAGSGKGNITWTRTLIEAIQKRNFADGNNPSLLTQLLQNGDDVQQCTQIIIPANSSAAGFTERFNEQSGKGMIFETEGDTIANIFKTDYGNWSDMLRKAFHHETISQYRKTDKVYVDIAEPQLSAVISSTPNQLARIVSSTENGLFSRMAFIFTEPIEEFMDVFTNHGSDRKKVFNDASKEMLKLFMILSKKESVAIAFSNEQRIEFLDFFNKAKSQLTNLFHEDLDASVNRMGLIMFRICMVLTILRKNESNIEEDNICSDDDFATAKKLAEILLVNANRAMQLLPKQGESQLSGSRLSIFQSLPNEFTRAEAIEVGKRFVVSGRTVDRFLDSACFEKIVQGRYRKAG